MNDPDSLSWKLVRHNRLRWIRRSLLFLFPVISLLYRNWPGTVIVLLLSLCALILDRTRSQRRVMSFTLFLVIVWGIQVLSFILTLSVWDFARDPSYPAFVSSLDESSLAMKRWEEFDKIRLSKSNVWSNASVVEFPWLSEFPPLSAIDPKPLIKTASVILVAHNEELYLERTIDSILNSTLPEQLAEIIVVDDASTPSAQESVMAKMDPSHLTKVRVVRHEQREGLIRSKLEGANIAVGDLVVFLDAHVKPEENWLLPFLHHTNENYKRVVVPLIPILNGTTWTVDSTAIGIKMMFDWGLGFSWFDDGNDWVPIMSGGLLGITRRYWHESGEYDKDMLMWGGENIEQSVRIWLCGGEVVVARNSRISHVFRPNFPYAINHTQVTLNKVRTVEVWFDEYREFFYRADPFAQTLVDKIGDTSHRESLKQRLECKPFQYFVDRFRDIFNRKNMLPRQHAAIKDEVSGECLQVKKGGEIKLNSCAHATGSSSKKSMRFVINDENKLIKGIEPSSANKNEAPPALIYSLKYGTCLDANGGYIEKMGITVLMYACMPKNVQQMNWDIAKGGISWNSTLCLTMGNAGNFVFGNCSHDSASNSGFLSGSHNGDFYGSPNHRFALYDLQKLEIAKSDKELKDAVTSINDEDD